MKITRSFLSVKHPRGICGLLGLTLLFSFKLQAETISLNDAEQIAVKQDPAQQVYQSQQEALMAQGVASATLADPMIKLGAANMPTDSFKFDEDPMTQLSVGLSQQFSRGDTRGLSQKGFNERSQLAVFKGLDRQLIVKRSVRQLWLNILFVEKSLNIVKENKQLFSSFYRDLEAQFSLGMVENEDLLAAEIELNKFDDKIAGLMQMSANQRSLLSEWIGQYAYDDLPDDIPQWQETRNLIDVSAEHANYYALLSQHPKAKLLAQNIVVADNGIDLAKQSYKPSFKVEVGYGYRFRDSDTGQSRANLLSGFITMDIPLFTDKRQDQRLISAQQTKGQKQAEHRLLLRQLNAQLATEIVNYRQIKARQARYQSSLLKQAKLHAELLEQSYQSNTRTFKEVIEAYIHQQNLILEYQQLYFDGLKSLSKIRYFQAL
ncbi:TolC family protein [Psychromonas sp. PT13]|uniref:TolC family protein n=1 Tax=Psychromonas sp. PT13 TaxID=3439547 RepID=UPI003EB6A96C